MGILELLTLVFIVLKLTDHIDWSWFWVLSPMILVVILYIMLIGVPLSILMMEAGT